ncbi:MAG TPA: hypothetical protein VNK23_10295 [Candidatus Dormibacteraeota bacterium]|nr:hypothetical protein [Candidatus Dormibacteraeota bacterium]
MRGLGSLAGLLVVALIAALTYKLYFQKSSAVSGSATPQQTIDVVGVKSDLLSIGQAERLYQAQHGSYGSIDDLVSSGAMSVRRSGRDGYTYDVNASSDSFQAIAHCPVATNPGCINYSIDQTMDIQATP